MWWWWWKEEGSLTLINSSFLSIRAKFHANPSDSWYILLKINKANQLLVLEERSGEPKSSGCILSLERASVWKPCRSFSCWHVHLWSSAGHQTFLRPTNGDNLKIKLYLHHSNFNIVYRSKSDNQDRSVLSQGVLVTPLDPQLEGRLTVEGSQLIFKKVHVSDTGVFKVTDLAGFPVAHVHIEVQRKRKRHIRVIMCQLSQNSELSPVHVMEFLEENHVKHHTNTYLATDFLSLVLWAKFDYFYDYF